MNNPIKNNESFAPGSENWESLKVRVFIKAIIAASGIPFLIAAAEKASGLKVKDYEQQIKDFSK